MSTLNTEPGRNGNKRQSTIGTSKTWRRLTGVGDDNIFTINIKVCTETSNLPKEGKRTTRMQRSSTINRSFAGKSLRKVNSTDQDQKATHTLKVKVPFTVVDDEPGPQCKLPLQAGLYQLSSAFGMTPDRSELLLPSTDQVIDTDEKWVDMLNGWMAETAARRTARITSILAKCKEFLMMECLADDLACTAMHTLWEVSTKESYELHFTTDLLEIIFATISDIQLGESRIHYFALMAISNLLFRAGEVSNRIMELNGHRQLLYHVLSKSPQVKETTFDACSIVDNKHVGMVALLRAILQSGDPSMTPEELFNWVVAVCTSSFEQMSLLGMDKSFQLLTKIVCQHGPTIVKRRTIVQTPNQSTDVEILDDDNTASKHAEWARNQGAQAGSLLQPSKSTDVIELVVNILSEFQRIPPEMLLDGVGGNVPDKKAQSVVSIEMRLLWLIALVAGNKASRMENLISLPLLETLFARLHDWLLVPEPIRIIEPVKSLIELLTVVLWGSYKAFDEVIQKNKTEASQTVSEMQPATSPSQQQRKKSSSSMSPSKSEIAFDWQAFQADQLLQSHILELMQLVFSENYSSRTQACALSIVTLRAGYPDMCKTLIKSRVVPLIASRARYKTGMALKCFASVASHIVHLARKHGRLLRHQEIDPFLNFVDWCLFQSNEAQVQRCGATLFMDLCTQCYGSKLDPLVPQPHNQSVQEIKQQERKAASVSSLSTIQTQLEELQQSCASEQKRNDKLAAAKIACRITLKVLRLCPSPEISFKPNEFYICFAVVAGTVPILQTSTVAMDLGTSRERHVAQLSLIHLITKCLSTLEQLSDSEAGLTCNTTTEQVHITNSDNTASADGDTSTNTLVSPANVMSLLQLSLLAFWEYINISSNGQTPRRKLSQIDGGVELVIDDEVVPVAVNCMLKILSSKRNCRIDMSFDRVIFLTLGILWNILKSRYRRNSEPDGYVEEDLAQRFKRNGFPEWQLVCNVTFEVAAYNILRVDTRIRASALFELLFKERNCVEQSKGNNDVEDETPSVVSTAEGSSQSVTGDESQQSMNYPVQFTDETAPAEELKPSNELDGVGDQVESSIPNYDELLTRLLCSAHLDLVRFAARAVARIATNATQRDQLGKLGALDELLRLIKRNTTLLDENSIEDLLLAILCLSCTARNQLVIVRHALKTLINVSEQFDVRRVKVLIASILRNCAQQKENRTKLFKAELAGLASRRKQAISKQRNASKTFRGRSKKRRQQQREDSSDAKSLVESSSNGMLDSSLSSASTVLTASDCVAALVSRPSQGAVTSIMQQFRGSSATDEENSRSSKGNQGSTHNDLKQVYENWLRMVDQEAKTRKETIGERLAYTRKAGKRRAMKEESTDESLGSGLLQSSNGTLDNSKGIQDIEVQSSSWKSQSYSHESVTEERLRFPSLNHKLRKSINQSLLQSDDLSVSNGSVYQEITERQTSPQKGTELFWRPFVKGYIEKHVIQEEEVAEQESQGREQNQVHDNMTILVYPNARFAAAQTRDETSTNNPKIEQRLRNEKPSEFLARCSKTQHADIYSSKASSVTLSQFRDNRIEVESVCAFVPPTPPKPSSAKLSVVYPSIPNVVEPFQTSPIFLEKFEAHLVGTFVEFPTPEWGHTFEVEYSVPPPVVVCDDDRDDASVCSQRESVLNCASWRHTLTSTGQSGVILGRFSTKSLGVSEVSKRDTLEHASDVRTLDQSLGNLPRVSASVQVTSDIPESSKANGVDIGSKLNSQSQQQQQQGKADSLVERKSMLQRTKRSSTTNLSFTNKQTSMLPPIPGSKNSLEDSSTSTVPSKNSLEDSSTSTVPSDDAAEDARKPRRSNAREKRSSTRRGRTSLTMVAGNDADKRSSTSRSTSEKPRRRNSGRVPIPKGSKSGSLSLAGGVIASNSRKRPSITKSSESRFGKRKSSHKIVYFDPYWTLKDDSLEIHVLLKKKIRPKVRRYAISKSTWNINDSMFKRREGGENAVGGIPECEKLMDACREKDWSRLITKTGFMRYFVRSFNEVSRNARKKLLPEDDLETIKLLIFQYYNPLMNAYRHFSTRGTDPFSLSLIALSELMTECGVVTTNSKRFKKKDIDNIFIASAVQDKNLKENANNPKTGLIRAEFLEAIIRVAIAKFGSQRERKDNDILPSSALERLLMTHFAEDDDGEEYGATDPNYFRYVRMYNRAVDIVLKAHLTLLKHLYEKSIAWASNKPGKMMSITDWLGFLDRFSLITKHHSERDAVFNFLTGKLPTVDELLRRNEYKCCRFLDFCEMLCRVVDTTTELEREEVPVNVRKALEMYGAFDDEHFGVHLAYKLHAFFLNDLLPKLAQTEGVARLRPLKYSEIV